MLLVRFALWSAVALPGVDAPSPADYGGLSWRFAGPLRGGWATAACGIPGDPRTFYFGAADGGVFKTTDAGRTWQALFDRGAVASIGALVVAPSDPRILYAGTGQVTTRWDVVAGNGVYRSKDAGATWRHVGLAESQHVGRIWVDPRDADTLLVAALGHLHGPNAERGVFRSQDGGATWARVLFVDESTGAVDLAGDPASPDVLFAATWEARRFPWQAYFTPIEGPGSGIWRSIDAGRTWMRLAGEGIPKAPLGRIGLAVAPGVESRRVYATIGAGPESGLYRSDDRGDRWTRVNADGSLAADYFAMLAVDPRDPETVHVMGRSIRTSTDGGTTFRFTRGSPGGDDYHFLWIDPVDPERRIAASDQGAVVTVNDGATWSGWYNQPTGQLYRVSTDDRFPYRIYSGQQDSGTVAIASRSDYGQITARDWHPVGGDERDTDIPFPGNPDIVYGSGLGGRLSRWDARTGQVQVVSPWPESSYARRPDGVKYRSTWLSPLAISKHPPHAIYMASQFVHRSLDGGESWQVISPDLTGAAAGGASCAGNVPVERATECGYGVVFSLALSARSADLIWAGTDNGRIHLTRDGGATWTDATPKGLSDWSKVASIDASPSDPATAYAAVDRHRLDDARPYVYVTHDFGATWREASTGLPPDGYLNVVRQDPERSGLLYAGSSRGVFVSFDDGAQWGSLQLDFPTTGVNDLHVHGNDLIAATQGRGIWVLDDVSPLRQLTAEVRSAEVALFRPATAYRLSPNQNRDTPLPVDEPRAENPPTGAVIDYRLARETREPVVLEFLDAKGEVVRSFRSDRAEERPHAEAYFPDDWIPGPAPLPARAGHNRFVWNLREPRPRASEYEYAMAAVPGVDTPALPQGLFVLPGTYEVRLTVDGKAHTQPLTVLADPRVGIPAGVLEQQMGLYREVVRSLESATDARSEIEGVAEKLRALGKEGSKSTPETRAAAEKLGKALDRFLKGASADNVSAVGSALGSLATDLESADAAPTGPQREYASLQARKLEGALASWRKARENEVQELDRRARDLGMTPILP